MIEPAVVVQRVVIGACFHCVRGEMVRQTLTINADTGGLKPSYFGPPESTQL
jgi:hypothetical protein